MVKVYGPMMSMDASGKLADTIVFSKWKGRNYVRNRVIPSNPQSGSQVGVRAMFRFLSQQWATLLDADRASWLDRATAAVVSNFNAYMGFNQDRWRRGLSPTHQDPVGDDGEYGNINWDGITAGVRMATLNFTRVAPQRHWGCIIARSLTTGFTPALDTTKLIVSLRTGADHDIVDAPLAAGEYFYRVRYFNFDGHADPAWVAEDSVVVTDA